MSSEPERRWSLSAPALEALLQRLGAQGEVAAREYDTVRRHLIGFFERRGIPWADALADETIDRVARRLAEGETIGNLKAYFYGVARYVALEAQREGRVQERAWEKMPGPHVEAGEDVARGEARIACLERCLAELPPDARELIVQYHRGRLGDRQRLADDLGLSYSTLKARAHRIRIRLGGCLLKCTDAVEVGRHT